jgi:hypothetical protein
MTCADFCAAIGPIGTALGCPYQACAEECDATVNTLDQIGCTTEFWADVDCTLAQPATAWTCNGGGTKPVFSGPGCDAEANALDACIGN